MIPSAVFVAETHRCVVRAIPEMKLPPRSRSSLRGSVRALGAALALAAMPALLRAAALPPVPYPQRPEVRAFITEMVEQHAFDRRALSRVFAQARFQPQIVAAVERPVVAPPKWYAYAPQFLSASRIDAGVAFWNAHQPALARAEERFGVPAEVIVAIIGVETFYGRNTGRHRVIDALSTLAFDYPRRAPFFRGELKQFLLLARELSISPLVPLGSYAGAMGQPQFMPGSYRNYATDFDADGRIDLWASVDDVIGSVANYLARHDWQRGQPVLLAATLDAAHEEEVVRRLDGGLSERRSLEAWAADGVGVAVLPAPMAPEPVGLLLLEELTPAGEANRYAIACHNFYVITRYNRSRLYATAVWELAVAVKSARAAR
jgi:membrane-bound lytic murein transglycosylase B